MDEVTSQWGASLGLLPVPLVAGTDFHRSVLLDGGAGSFCLDLAGITEPSEAWVRAWSSDVYHYLTLDQTRAHVYRWKNRNPETWLREEVEEDLARFYDRILVVQRPSGVTSVVGHVMRVFRGLQNSLGRSYTGHQALEAFLYLFACALVDSPRAELDVESWQMGEEAKSTAAAVSLQDWESLIDALKGVQEPLSLRPDLSLVLRHTSGRLFQEAHAEVGYQDQLTFFGPPPARPLRGRTRKMTTHFTPPAIVRSLVEEALADLRSAAEITVFDPGCGSGEFLRETLRQLRTRHPSTTRVNILGWDVSPSAVSMAKFVLANETREWGTKANVNIELRDALDDDWPRDVDVILMNPPFVSWENLDSRMKSKVKNALGSLWGPRADLSSAFVWLALDALRDDGVLASIVPASLLHGTFTQPLRSAISSKAAVRLIGRLGDQSVFWKATVDAGLLVLNKSDEPRACDITLLWSDEKPQSLSSALRALRRRRYTGSLAHPFANEASFSVYSAPQPGGLQGSDWVPRAYRSVELIGTLAGIPRAKDLFQVIQGAHTGSNKAFLVSEEELVRLPEAEQLFFRPAVLGSSIRMSQIRTGWYVFYPYDQPVDYRDEHKMRSLLPRYFETKLDPSRSALLRRPAVSGSGLWWLLNRPRHSEFAGRAQLISSFFGGAGSWGWDPAGGVVVVQGYLWKPSPTQISPERPWEDVGLAYFALLNCPLLNEILEGVSPRVAGGQFDLSRRYMLQLPLPNLFSSDGRVSEHIFLDLLLKGGQLAAQSIDQTDPELRELVGKLFGLLR